VCSGNDPLERDDFELEEKVTSNITDLFLSGNCAEYEAIIQAASFHLEQTKVMRELAQKCAQEKKDDIENGVLHPEKRYCLVCDYAKNLGIPYFGKEQTGDTYYYSNLSINMCGRVNPSRSPRNLE
jgi:hypothetical protein